MLKWTDPLIYTAGKTWSAELFKDMRRIGYNINARWIDIQDTLSSPNDEFNPEIHANEGYKQDIWDNGCKVDCVNCDLGIIFANKHDKNMHSGSLVELGHITASYLYSGINKPVYIIGSCESFEPAGNSDRAWRSQKDVFYWPNVSLVKGFQSAIAHYIANYTSDYHNARAISTYAARQV